MSKHSNKKPNIVGIIPARYGSTRFPGKPLVKILGKTLIQRTYENAKHCALIDKLLVATDDQRIYDHVREFGGDVVMTPEDIANGSDRSAYVLKNDPSLQNAKVVINIQGDEPCIDPDVLKKVSEILLSDPAAVMSTAVVPLSSEEEANNPNVVKCVLDLHHNVLYFSRALIPGHRKLHFRKEVSYFRHVGIYAFRSDFLLKYGSLPMTPLQRCEDLEQLKVLEHGYKIKAAIISSIGLDVNSPEDIQKVEQELCKQSSFSSPAGSVHP